MQYALCRQIQIHQSSAVWCIMRKCRAHMRRLEIFVWGPRLQQVARRRSRLIIISIPLVSFRFVSYGVLVVSVSWNLNSQCCGACFVHARVYVRQCAMFRAYGTSPVDTSTPTPPWGLPFNSVSKGWHYFSPGSACSFYGLFHSKRTVNVLRDKTAVLVLLG